MRSDADLRASRLALRWLVQGEWRAFPLRFFGTALAIAVGVALGFAVHLVNGSALTSFESAVRGVNGAADLQVRATSPLGFDEALYPAVIGQEGVADASPVVSLDARTDAGSFTLLGLDVIRAAQVTPTLIGLRTSGPDTGGQGAFATDALFLSRSAAEELGASVGDELLVTANNRQVPLRVAGLLPGVPDGQRIGVLDIAAAQWRFDRLGRLDRIDLAVADAPTAERTLRAALPADAVVSSEASESAQGSALSRAYRVNLQMLALVALLTGGFLVFSAQSLSVARRLRAFALLRTLGLPRRGIVAVVALEGAVIGVLGSGAGLLAGAGLATVAISLLGGDLGAGYFRGGEVRLSFSGPAAITFFALGVAAAMLGSILPARAASKAAPAVALKNGGDILDPRKPVPWKPSVILVAAGVASSLLPAIEGLPVFGFLGMALLLAGGVAGVPWLARQLLAPLARRASRSVPRLLSIRHVHGAPGEAATALCGIVASTALMIAMATMVTSFRGAVDTWLEQILAADLYLRVEGGADMPPDIQDALRRIEGVGTISFTRQVPLTLAADQPPVTLIARPLHADGTDAALVPVGPSAAVPAGTVPVWASEPAARLYGWRAGDEVALPIAGGARFAVAGVWRDYSRQSGALVIRSEDYERLTGDRNRDEAAVTLQPGADAGAIGEALLAALPPDLREATTLARPAELRRFALELFDRSFLVTYVLEAVAILVGLAGVAATMLSQTVARQREFGMLRHLGLEKRQILRMLATEGTLLGLLGGLVGACLGGALSQVLIHVINPQSFNWTMATIVPWGTVAGVVAALALAAGGTAIAAGRRATAPSAVLAVREDW